MKRSNFSVVLYLLAVFVSGAVVGAFGHRLYTVRTVDAAPQPRNPAEFRQRYINDLRGRLHLDEGQTTAVAAVLDRTRSRFRQFNEKHRPELSQIHETQIREIQALLSPEQQVLYDEYRKERDRKKQEFTRK